MIKNSVPINMIVCIPCIVQTHLHCIISPKKSTCPLNVKCEKASKIHKYSDQACDICASKISIKRIPIEFLILYTMYILFCHSCDNKFFNLLVHAPVKISRKKIEECFGMFCLPAK